MSEEPADNWRQRLRILLDQPLEGDRSARASRGREFERVLHAMLDEAGLEPRTSFRPRGEEIDGSFLLDGRVMLLEAKWATPPQPASSLYAFRGKIEGKLAGTLGLFVSMSGFSEDAVNALIAGKSLNLILMDHEDLLLVADHSFDIGQALRLKLRAAAEEGTPYLQLKSAALTTRAKTVIFVEGPADQQALSTLISIQGKPTNGLEFLVANGRDNLPRVARWIVSSGSIDAKKLLIVVDSDMSPRLVREDILRALGDHGDQIDVIVLDPELLRQLWMNDTQGRIDFRTLANKNPEIRRLLRHLGLLSD